MIILQDNNSWKNILARLKMDFPEIPGLRQSSKATAGNLTDAIGSLNAVREFYRLIDRPFSPESWRGEELEIPKQPGIRESVKVAFEIVAVVALARQRLKEKEACGYRLPLQRRFPYKRNARMIRRE